MFEILFLGTAGARYVVAKQLRASAGLLFRNDRDYLLIDPGPGTLVCLAKYKLYPEKIKSLLVSHKHLDHSADLNILVDAITEGGFKKRGKVFLPEEILLEGLLLPYLKEALKELVILSEKNTYHAESFVFHTTRKLLHSAETFGFIFEVDKNKKLGLITDTAYFDGLLEEFKGVSYLIINTVRYQPKEGVLHLSIPDVKLLLMELQPEITVLTHFGMTMLKANPFRVARELSSELNLKVLSAYDGMKLSL
jgi:ribonuclease BN (tRNA processing enzyme)